MSAVVIRRAAVVRVPPAAAGIAVGVLVRFLVGMPVHPLAGTPRDQRP